MLNYDVKQLIPFSVNNGYAPSIDIGPKTVPLNLDFTNDGSIYVDLSAVQAQGIIGLIQAIEVDNTQNSAALVVTVKQSGQRIVFPALAKFCWPLFCPDPCQLVFSTTQAALIINAQLLNVPLAPASMGPVTVNATITVTGSYTNAADNTINLGGTSQQLFAANALRKGLYIENPATNTESVFIEFGATPAVLAAPSIEITPGGNWQTQLQISTQAVNWNAATTGTAVIAKELA